MVAAHADGVREADATRHDPRAVALGGADGLPVVRADAAPFGAPHALRHADAHAKRAATDAAADLQYAGPFDRAFRAAWARAQVLAP